MFQGALRCPPPVVLATIPIAPAGPKGRLDLPFDNPRRITLPETFSTRTGCWPANRSRARGGSSHIRNLVGDIKTLGDDHAFPIQTAFNLGTYVQSQP